MEGFVQREKEGGVQPGVELITCASSRKRNLNWEASFGKHLLKQRIYMYIESTRAIHGRICRQRAWGGCNYNYPEW